jgi:hypothetical protein
VKKPDISLLNSLMTQERERYGGTLPDLVAIAWRGYLMALVGEVIDHLDYDQLRHHFPEIQDDPVSYIVCGKHYLMDEQELNATNGSSEFVDETDMEALRREIKSDSRHLGGTLPTRFAVAWHATLLAHQQWQLLSKDDYDSLVLLLPEIENNPVASIKTAMMNAYGVQ